MKNDETDWKEIIAHTRLRAREAGFDSLDELVSADRRNTGDARKDLLSYLDSFISALKERSRSGSVETLEILSRVVDTESGKPIDGIEIDVQEVDSALFQAPTISIEDLDDFDGLISELARIRQMVNKTHD